MKKNESSEKFREEILRAEEAAGRTEEKKYRLEHHLMPPAGWMNDPNGLCFYNGKYHVFFQYSPQDVNGGLKCWGHYESEDLIHWDYLGVPLIPDTPWDKDGVYSGSAFTDDGLLELFYTGNTKEDGTHDYILSGRGANILHVESRDGKTFGEKELLLTNEEYPDDYTCHVRDPKVWKENGVYRMILGGRKKEGKGAALLYRSFDKKKWELFTELTTEESFGYMWECPDFFKLDGRYVLSVSPQGLPKEMLRFQNIYQSGYFLQEESVIRKGKNSVFISPQSFKEWDMGFDFYAPQTFVDAKGRRILLAWAGLPDMEQEYGNGPSVAEGWQHSMTMFRELIYKDGKIFQNPVEEYKNLRKNEIFIRPGEPVEFENSAEIEILFDPAEKGKKEICLDESIRFAYENGILELKFLDDSGCGRSVRRAEAEKLESLRIFTDRSMLEIYVNMGELVFTARYFMRDNKRKLFILSHVLNVQAWQLDKMVIKKKQIYKEELQ